MVIKIITYFCCYSIVPITNGGKSIERLVLWREKTCILRGKRTMASTLRIKQLNYFWQKRERNFCLISFSIWRHQSWINFFLLNFWSNQQKKYSRYLSLRITITWIRYFHVRATPCKSEHVMTRTHNYDVILSTKFWRLKINFAIYRYNFLLSMNFF